MPKNRVVFLRLSTTSLLAALLSAALLGGCAVAPTQDDSKLLASVPNASLERGSQLERQGKASDAAKLYLELAAKATPPAKAQLQIRAASAYLSAGQSRQAKQTISTISQRDLTPGQQNHYLLLQGDLALLSRQPKDAVSYLRRVKPESLPKYLQVKWLGSLAASERQTGSTLAAAETLDQLDGMLETKTERLTNQVSLVSTLGTLSREKLQDLARSGRGNMKGWAEIALFANSAEGDSSRLENTYRNWRRTHMLHPAMSDLGRALSGSLPGGYTAATRLTVVLPNEGRFASAASAVRRGIEAASRTDSGTGRPLIDFAPSTNAVRSRINKGSTGADYVIGPLEKQSVDELVAGKPLSVTTLALNESTRSSQRVKNLYQFSLSPENEAAEVARKAQAMGLKRAFIAYPEGDWGTRLARAFRSRWESLGGKVADIVRYSPTSSRAPSETAERLKASQSDLVFLVATAEGARKLYPALRSAVPDSTAIMSTSHVYTGDFNPKRDGILNGLYFVDIPWMLQDSEDAALSRRTLASGSDPLARLCAMGIDAYRLAPRLEALSKTPGSYFQGETGGLSIDSQGRVRRQLALGRFTASGPERADKLKR